MSDDGLLPYERQVWRALIEAGKTWRARGTEKTAKAFGRAAGAAFKVPVPQPRDEAAMWGALGLLRAARAFPTLSAAARELEWPKIGAALGALGEVVGDDAPPAVAPREPAAAWWLD